MVEWLPEWLFEGQITVYAVLAVALIALGVVWKQTPRTGYLVGCVAVVLLLALYALLDLFVVTDREQITRAVQEMSAGVEAHNVNRIFENVSESYNRHGSNKAAFRSATAGVIEGRQVDQVIMWALEFPPDYKKKESASDPRATLANVRFMAKPVGNGGMSLFLIDAVMHRDADGAWRLQSWEAFDPYHDTKTPIPVPHVP